MRAARLHIAETSIPAQCLAHILALRIKCSRGGLGMMRAAKHEWIFVRRRNGDLVRSASGKFASSKARTNLHIRGAREHGQHTGHGWTGAAAEKERRLGV